MLTSRLKHLYHAQVADWSKCKTCKLYKCEAINVDSKEERLVFQEIMRTFFGLKNFAAISLPNK